MLVAGGGFEMSRSVFRFIPYTTLQDQTVEPEYSAECVSGKEKACGEKSGLRSHPTDVEAWMRTHMKETRHRHFRRRIDDFAELVPTDGLPAELESAKVARVTP
jgi:hypothetical protein